MEFSKLRFKEFAKAAAAGTIVGAVALQSAAALAATGSVQITVGNAKWFVNTNITFSTTSSGGLAFSEASLHTTGTANNFNRNDAFDGVLTWHVNASPPPGSLSAGGYKSPGGTVSVTADSVIGTTQVMVGLNVHVELFFSAQKSVARNILFLQNPTGAPITVTVDNDNNLGSDSNTSIQATSSGDATFDATDNWFVSCQQGGTPGVCDLTADPILTFAFQQTGVAVRGASIPPVFTNGNDNPNFRYTVTVPAGATRAVMFFVQLSDTAAHATADAALFNTNVSLQSTDYLSGLSGAEMSEIVNWTVSPPVPSVPTLSRWALMGATLLLLLAGFFGGRRYRPRAQS